MELYKQVRDRALKDGITPKLLRDASPITVSTFDKKALEKCAEQLFYPEKNNIPKHSSTWYVLRSQNEEYYSEDMGMQLAQKEDEEFVV